MRYVFPNLARTAATEVNSRWTPTSLYRKSGILHTGCTAKSDSEYPVRTAPGPGAAGGSPVLCRGEGPRQPRGQERIRTGYFAQVYSEGTVNSNNKVKSSESSTIQC